MLTTSSPMSVFHSLSLSIYLSIYLFISLTLSLSLSIYLSIYLSIFLFIHYFFQPCYLYKIRKPIHKVCPQTFLSASTFPFRGAKQAQLLVIIGQRVQNNCPILLFVQVQVHYLSMYPPPWCRGRRPLSL